MATIDRTSGHFYVIQLAPDVVPQRIKLGWALDPLKRLTDHRCAAPTARLVHRWPCHREWEGSVIRTITAEGCRSLSREAFDVDALDVLVKRAEQFFSANDTTAPRVRLHQLPSGYRLTRLRDIRMRKALNQQELASAAGIARATLSRLEAGLQEPYPSTARKLARALGVKSEELMEPRSREA